VALHFIRYNFPRIHKTLGITPAMAAGISDQVWSYEEIARFGKLRWGAQHETSSSRIALSYWRCRSFFVFIQAAASQGFNAPSRALSGTAAAKAQDRKLDVYWFELLLAGRSFLFCMARKSKLRHYPN
jgi:hypothetical protein